MNNSAILRDLNLTIYADRENESVSSALANVTANQLLIMRALVSVLENQEQLDGDILKYRTIWPDIPQ